MSRRIIWLAAITSMAWLSALPLRADESASAEVDRRLADEVFARWPGQPLAPRTKDEIFLRRVYLDLVGQQPTPAEVRQFVGDSAPDKRSAKIAALLGDPRFGANAAYYWRDVILARAQTAGEGPSVHLGPTEAWFTQQFNDNVPWDQIVRSLVAAQGPFRDHGEAALFLAQRFAPVGVAGEMSRIFLGIQIQCAECHDHPTDRWKRQQFHEFAAFFPRVGSAPFERTKGARRESQVASFDDAPQVRPPNMRYAGVPEYFMPDLQDPSSQGTLIAPGFFVTGKRLEAGALDAQRRQSLAEWLTARDNPWFAKAFVNRVWAELVGEGFYEPIDDLGPDRSCSAPQTLEFLADTFTDRNYDIKWLYRTILETAAYQRESRPRRKPDEAPFAANVPQPLRADQIGSVLSQVVGYDVIGSRLSPSRQNLMLTPLHTLFGYDPSSRRDEVASSIPQALLLMNSEVLNRAVTARNGDSLLAKLLAAAKSDEQAVIDLYLQTLAREPSEREKKVCLEHVKSVGDRGDACRGFVLGAPQFGRAPLSELGYREGIRHELADSSSHPFNGQPRRRSGPPRCAENVRRGRIGDRRARLARRPQPASGGAAQEKPRLYPALDERRAEPTGDLRPEARPRQQRRNESDRDQRPRHSDRRHPAKAGRAGRPVRDRSFAQYPRGRARPGQLCDACLAPAAGEREAPFARLGGGP